MTWETFLEPFKNPNHVKFWYQLYTSSFHAFIHVWETDLEVAEAVAKA